MDRKIEIKTYRPKEINICDRLQLVEAKYGYDIFIDGIKQENVLSLEFKVAVNKKLTVKIERYL